MALTRDIGCRGGGAGRWGLAFVVFLFVLINPSTYGAEFENPWDFLQDFRHIQGSARAVDENYAAALFDNAEKQLRALVVFPIKCGNHGCTLEKPVAYSVFDAKGAVVRSYEETIGSPLQKILTSVSVTFSAA